jgi:hypothetical protein
MGFLHAAELYNHFANYIDEFSQLPWHEPQAGKKDGLVFHARRQLLQRIQHP